MIDQPVVHDGEGIVSRKRRGPCKHFVQHDTSCINIAPSITAFAPDLFRGNVIRRAHDLRQFAKGQPSPRWTPENRPYVDTSKPANEVAELRTRSVIPREV